MFFLIWNKVRHGWAFYQLGQQKFCWKKCWVNNFFPLSKWVKMGLLEMQNGIFSSTMCKTFQTAYGFFYTHKTEFGYYDSFFAQQKVISRIILRVKSIQIERTKEKNPGELIMFVQYFLFSLTCFPFNIRFIFSMKGWRLLRLNVR